MKFRNFALGAGASLLLLTGCSSATDLETEVVATTTDVPSMDSSRDASTDSTPSPTQSTEPAAVQEPSSNQDEDPFAVDPAHAQIYTELPAVTESDDFHFHYLEGGYLVRRVNGSESVVTPSGYQPEQWDGILEDEAGWAVLEGMSSTKFFTYREGVLLVQGTVGGDALNAGDLVVARVVPSTGEIAWTIGLTEDSENVVNSKTQVTVDGTCYNAVTAAEEGCRIAGSFDWNGDELELVHPVLGPIKTFEGVTSPAGGDFRVSGDNVVTDADFSRVGNAQLPSEPGISAFGPDGTLLWFQPTKGELIDADESLVTLYVKDTGSGVVLDAGTGEPLADWAEGELIPEYDCQFAVADSPLVAVDCSHKKDTADGFFTFTATE